jgi:hypothetical protein
MLFGITFFELFIGLILVLIFILLILMAPLILRRRILSGVTKKTVELEDLVDKSELILIDLCKEKGKPSENPQKIIKNFMEFFMIPPVDLDPYRVVRKLDKILEMSEERFQYMAQQAAPQADEEWKSNIIMTLKATLGINSVAKQVRHNLELAKKTGNLQILLMLQMSLPLIKRIVNAQFEGVKAFSKGKPIGDGLGPLVMGMMLGEYSSHHKDLKQNGMTVNKQDFQGREVIITRAQGPGGRVGKVGKTVNSIIESEGIKRIITVDAAIKLEGEKTGLVAEGIGVVIGGPGVDKWLIEENLVEKNLQVDAVIVKMSPEDAISPMKLEIFEASEKALSVVKESILRSDRGSKILVVGVGNSCGIPDIISDELKIELKKELKKKPKNEKENNGKNDNGKNDDN